ncbi:amino acid--tRNA ligase-related protein [Dasania phycosphaerae]
MGNTVAAKYVLAVGIGEIIGGSQREQRLEVLGERMAELGLSGQLGGDRDLRRYGSLPHAGFGLGFERLLNDIAGKGNICDVVPFARTLIMQMTKAVAWDVSKYLHHHKMEANFCAKSKILAILRVKFLFLRCCCEGLGKSRKAAGTGYVWLHKAKTATPSVRWL